MANIIILYRSDFCSVGLSQHQSQCTRIKQPCKSDVNQWGIVVRKYCWQVGFRPRWRLTISLSPPKTPITAHMHSIFLSYLSLSHVPLLLRSQSADTLAMTLMSAINKSRGGASSLLATGLCWEQAGLCCGHLPVGGPARWMALCPELFTNWVSTLHTPDLCF